MSPPAETPIRIRVRADALPEHTRYRDDGCDVHPHCLTCPLPRCRYDEPGGLRALLNAHRDRQIVEMRLRGVPVGDLAGRFGLSRRTVFRILENGGRPTGPLGKQGRNGHRLPGPNGHSAGGGCASGANPVGGPKGLS